MAKHLSEPLVTRQHFTDALGCSLSEHEFQSKLKQCRFLKPKVGKFWQGTDVEAGIYVVIAGKVRLLDCKGELITTIETGGCFGEFTLFPEAKFQAYAARASINLHLCFVPSDILLSLMNQYPQIQEHLWSTAGSRNSLLIKDSLGTENTLKCKETEKHLGGDRNTKIREYENVLGSTTSKDTAVPKSKNQKKISKAYFPSPTQKFGHLWQRFTRRYPYFAQQSVSDCGAACLVMVSRYWGKRFSVNRLRDMANIDRNGASLRGLSSAAESIGFSTRPVKASLDKLAKQKLPAIVHWQGKHYIVVY